MSAANFQVRLDLLKKGLSKHGLDALLVTDETNVSYLSGFAGHDSMLLVTRSDNYFITDSRYVEEAREKVRGFRIALVDKSTYETLSSIVRKNRFKKIGFEGMNLSYGVATRLARLARPAQFTATKGFVELIRMIKDAEEITLIKDSIRLNESVFKAASKKVAPGQTERAIAGIIEAMYLRYGGRAAFDPIVASGENASKPHAIPTDTLIKNNSFVMIDLGVRLNGYCSDMTRMIILGRVSAKFKKIYDVVRIAGQKAIASIRPGVRIDAIDRIARDHIADAGYGKYFGHSLGHGVGLAVHEKPTVSGLNDGFLQAGMVFTIEPAIYIPKFGGVRIEDMVLVNDNGCEVLTR